MLSKVFLVSVLIVVLTTGCWAAGYTWSLPQAGTQDVGGSAVPYGPWQSGNPYNDNVAAWYAYYQDAVAAQAGPSLTDPYNLMTWGAIYGDVNYWGLRATNDFDPLGRYVGNKVVVPGFSVDDPDGQNCYGQASIVAFQAPSAGYYAANISGTRTYVSSIYAGGVRVQVIALSADKSIGRVLNSYLIVSPEQGYTGSSLSYSFNSPVYLGAGESLGVRFQSIQWYWQPGFNNGSAPKAELSIQFTMQQVIPSYSSFDWKLPGIFGNAGQGWMSDPCDASMPTWTWDIGNPYPLPNASWTAAMQDEYNAPSLLSPYRNLISGLAYNYTRCWIGPDDVGQIDENHKYIEHTLSVNNLNPNCPGSAVAILLTVDAPGNYLVDIAARETWSSAPSAGYASVDIYTLGQNRSTATLLMNEHMNMNNAGGLPNQFTFSQIVSLNAGDEIGVRLQSVNPGSGAIGFTSLAFDNFHVKQIPTCGDAAHPYPAGDLNHDCHVNMKDLAILVSNWLVGNQ